MEINVTLAQLGSLADYADAGADRVIVMVPTGDERKAMKEIAEAASDF